MQLRASEVLDDVLPVRRIVELAQVRLEFSTEDLQCSALSDTVCSNETQHVSWSGHRQPVQLEAVGGISVGHLALEVRGQVDDGDGAERALLGTDTTSDAEGLGNEGESGVRRHFNAWSRDTCQHSAHSCLDAQDSMATDRAFRFARRDMPSCTLAGISNKSG